METSERNYKIPALIAVCILALGLGIYFFSNKGEEETTVESEIERVEQELGEARENLAEEREELDRLMEDLRRSAPAYAHASDHVEKLEKSVRETDRLFIGANSASPKLSLNVSFVLADGINGRRAQINQLLKTWREKVNIAVATSVTRATLQELTVDAEVILMYVRELEDIVKTATPENSGFSENQLSDILRSLVNIQLDIEATIASLKEILARNPDFPPANPPPPQQIIDQEAEVEVAEDEVERLEDELEALVGETWTWEDDNDVEYVNPLTRDDAIDENYSGPPRLIEYSNDIPEQ